MKEWTLRQGYRLAGVVTAISPAVVALLDSLPWAWAVTLSAVVLSAGEAAQRETSAAASPRRPGC